MTLGSSFCQKGHCIHILWYIFMRLGHNDSWVESHMWPQRMWDKRSSGSRTTSFAITYLCNLCNIRFDPIPVKVRKRSLTPRWPLTPRLLRSHVWLYLRIIKSKSHENTSKYVDTVTFFCKNLNQRSLTPALSIVRPRLWNKCQPTSVLLIVSPLSLLLVLPYSSRFFLSWPCLICYKFIIYFCPWLTPTIVFNYCLESILY